METMAEANLEKMVQEVTDKVIQNLQDAGFFVSRWIPVSERPPEEGKTVMASTNYGVYPEARYSKKYGWEWPFEAGADYWTEMVDSVEAWMELPKPYKAGSKENEKTC